MFALVGLLGYAFVEASAKAKIANAATNLAALVIFIPAGGVMWKVGLLMGLGNLAGGYVGARTAMAKGAGFIRIVLVVVVGAFIVKIGLDVHQAAHLSGWRRPWRRIEGVRTPTILRLDRGGKRGSQMPTPSLPDDVAALVAEPNPAVITSNRPDGQPVSVATWYLLEADGRILVNMDESRRRLTYLRQDPRVSLTVLAADDWYTHVSMQGRVVELSDDPDLVDIDRLSNHYVGGAYPNRTNKRVSARIEIERWHGWGAAKKRG